MKLTKKLRYCYIRSCINNKEGTLDDSVAFFRFSRELPNYLEWKKTIGAVQNPVLNTGVLCMYHFIEDDLIKISNGRPKLKTTAVPTIFREATDPNARVIAKNVPKPPANTNAVKVLNTLFGEGSSQSVSGVSNTFRINSTVSVLPVKRIIRINTHRNFSNSENEVIVPDPPVTLNGNFSTMKSITRTYGSKATLPSPSFSVTSPPVKEVPCMRCTRLDARILYLTKQLKLIQNQCNQKEFELLSLTTELDMLKSSDKPPLASPQQCSVCLEPIEAKRYMTHICREGIENIQCEYCPIEFASIINLTQHIMAFHKQTMQRFQCADCSCNFGMSLLYDFHMETVHGIDPFMKIIAEDSFENSLEVKTEPVDQTDEMDWSNNYDIEPDDDIVKQEANEFDDAALLAGSLSTASVKIEATESDKPADPIKSNEPSQAGKTIEPAKRVMKYYQCGKCSLSVETPADLGKHMKTHFPSPEYVCYLCNKKFWALTVLVRHMKQHCIAPVTCPCVLKKNNCKVCPAQCENDPSPKGYRKRCSICQTKFHNKCESHSHICNDAVKSVRCEYCSDTFESIKYLLEHLSIMHDDMNFYKCEKCPKIFSMLALHTFHMKAVHCSDREIEKSELNVKPINMESTAMDRNEMNIRLLKLFQCASCDMSFRIGRQLAQHITLKHQDLRSSKMLECYICKLRLTSMAAVRRHLEIEHPLPTDKCMICSETVPIVDLPLHSCVSRKTFRCEYCKKKFKSLYDLNQHLNTDHIEQEKLTYVCDVCSRAFQMRLLMTLHNDKHESGCYKCRKCDEAFDTKYERMRHGKTAHEVVASHLCEECGKAFVRERHLQSHKLSHKEPHLKCLKCPYKARMQQSMQRHISRRHQEVTKFFSCHDCGKKFDSAMNFSRHRKLHLRTEADRIFLCQMCPLKFFESDDLRNHMRAHSTSKDYQCTYCDKAYKHPGDLTKHLRTHLGENMYKCTKCPEAFRLPNDLEKHTFRHYEEEAEADKSMDIAEKVDLVA